MYQESEIKSLIDIGENSSIEFKSAAIKSDSLAREIVAFSNSQGGTIILGVEDNKEISGLPEDKNYEEWAQNISRNNIIPAVRTGYQELAIGNKKIAIIDVPKGTDRPYQTQMNQFLIRVGSTNRTATQSELLRLFQQSGIFHYDLIGIDNSSLKDLNLSKIDQYFRRYDIDFSFESAEEQALLIKNTDIMSEDLKITVAGLLIFGINPQKFLRNASVAFAHFNGNEVSDKLIDKQIIAGNLDYQVDMTMTVIKNNLLNPSIIKGAKRESNEFLFDDRVFRELIVNACVHRNYSIHGSQIRIFLFDDRIEFISPGRLPNTVTIDKLKGGVSFAVNPVIVKFMENLRYVDKLGRGLPMVWREARKNNKEVLFKEIGEEFKVILHI